MSGAARKERKLVTVLFADLVGFTARAESLDPEDVDAVLAPYHRHVRSELERFGGTGAVAVVLSGGNIDPTLLIQVMRHGLTYGGRYLVARTRVPDRPGELVKLLSLLARERANVLSVEHHREGMAVSIAETEVELTLQTRDEEHCADLVRAMHEWGYPVERLR